MAMIRILYNSLPNMAGTRFTVPYQIAENVIPEQTPSRAHTNKTWGLFVPKQYSVFRAAHKMAGNRFPVTAGLQQGSLRWHTNSCPAPTSMIGYRYGY